MPVLGETIQERYQIERVLGRGGTSTVYLARDLHTEARVAVKEVCLEASSEARRRALLRQFRLEADILSSLSHPGLPRVHDSFSQDGGFCYLVMDYIEGANLFELVRAEGAVTEHRAIDWASQIAGILSYLHTREPAVVLRDLKPSNLMLTEDGRVMMIDFGIAKLHDPENGLATQTSARGMLTPGFASPEHYSGGTDTSSDLYSLGATIYYVLTAKVPPESVDLLTGEKALTPLRVARPDLGEPLLELTERLLTLKRGNRPADAQSVRRELLQLRDQVQQTEYRPSTDDRTVSVHASLHGSPSESNWKSNLRRWRSAFVLSIALAGVLPALPKPWNTRVSVVSEPPNASVYINSSEVGMTPLTASLPKGRLMVHVSVEGRMPVTEVVTVDGGSNRLQVNLDPVSPQTPEEKAVLKQMQSPPSLLNRDRKFLPGYYPPPRGKVPWDPQDARRLQLGDLKFSLPAGWQVESEDARRVRMKDECRVWEVSVEPVTSLSERLAEELSRLKADGFSTVSEFSNDTKVAIRYQKGEHRGYLLLNQNSQRLAGFRIECNPCPKAAFLIQTFDILRGHVEEFNRQFAWAD